MHIYFQGMTVTISHDLTETVAAVGVLFCGRPSPPGLPPVQLECEDHLSKMQFSQTISSFTVQMLYASMVCSRSQRRRKIASFPETTLVGKTPVPTILAVVRINTMAVLRKTIIR